MCARFFKKKKKGKEILGADICSWPFTLLLATPPSPPAQEASSAKEDQRRKALESWEVAMIINFRQS